MKTKNCLNNKQMLIASKEVLLSCCLENGAVVAADSDKPYYPNRCQNYRFVWPTDAAYILLALKSLGIKEVQEEYFRWLIERAEDVKNDGLLFQNYYTNGPKRWLGFQPDANGKTLWLMHDYYDGKVPESQMPLLRLLAEGLLRMWNGRHFTIQTQDRWEERHTYPDLEDNHTYTLAACVHGLRCAYAVTEDERYNKAAEEMNSRINSAYQKCSLRNKKSFGKSYFFRTFGKLPDPTVDSSVLALVWPFGIVDAKDNRIVSTIRVIEDNLVVNGGLLRYECDMYSGWTYHTQDRRKGAGTWPILNLFMALYYAKKGDRKNALKYYNWVQKKFDRHIPEQVFENSLQQSISPLGWSHAMFVFATKELGLQ